MNTNIEVALQ